MGKLSHRSLRGEPAAGLAGDRAVAAWLALLEALEGGAEIGVGGTARGGGLASTDRSTARWGGCAHGRASVPAHALISLIGGMSSFAMQRRR
jgi:hypothetical protein